MSANISTCTMHRLHSALPVFDMPGKAGGPHLNRPKLVECGQTDQPTKREQQTKCAEQSLALANGPIVIIIYSNQGWRALLKVRESAQVQSWAGHAIGQMGSSCACGCSKMIIRNITSKASLRGSQVQGTDFLLFLFAYAHTLSMISSVTLAPISNPNPNHTRFWRSIFWLVFWRSRFWRSRFWQSRFWLVFWRSRFWRVTVDLGSALLGFGLLLATSIYY